MIEIRLFGAPMFIVGTAQKSIPPSDYREARVALAALAVLELWVLALRVLGLVALEEM
jgi:hypothetical protein